MKKAMIILGLLPILAQAQQIDTILSFGPDTVMYTLDGKASGINAYYMNTAVEYTAYGQYYDAPQELQISGFCFYAWVENTGMTAEVVCSMHQAMNDSLPGALIASDTITVTDNYSANLQGIRYCAEFDSPVVQDQPYVLSVQTTSALDLNIISNDAANEDGADEALAMYYWNGAGPGWRKNETFFSWDIDWILCPIVDYDVHVQASFDADTICQEDTINVSANMPDIWSHRMYNSSAFDGDEWQDLSWLISLNPPFIGYSANAPVQQYGDVPINLFVEYNGWRNTTMFPLSEDIHAAPQPVAGFEYVPDQLEVQFNDTSLFTDSVHWDFGDGSMISNDPMPLHEYATTGWYTVEMIAYNDCGSDTSTVDIQLMTTGILATEEQGIKIFPNPASDVLYVELEELPTNGMLQLIDVTGRVVHQGQVRSRIHLIELDATIHNGTYYLRVADAEQVFTVPVVVSK